jgi:hypothetical protein
MDAAQAALDAADAMQVKDECDGCHGIKDAAIIDAQRRIGLCEAATEVLDPLAGRLQVALQRLRQVPHDLGRPTSSSMRSSAPGGNCRGTLAGSKGKGAHLSGVNLY